MRVVTFGEIMLRLKPQEHERLFQSPMLEATFGGGEANVAVSLANFGDQATFVTVLPDNAKCRQNGYILSRKRCSPAPLACDIRQRRHCAVNR